MGCVGASEEASLCVRVGDVQSKCLLGEMKMAGGRWWRMQVSLHVYGSKVESPSGGSAKGRTGQVW